MLRKFLMLAIASTLILVACNERPLDRAPMQPSNNLVLAGPEDVIQDVKFDEEQIKTLLAPPSNTYEVLIERIKQSSQQDGSTESLIESVLDSEFLTLVYTRDDLQVGFDWFTENHQGLNELLKRQDAAQVVYEKHQNMSVIGFSPSASLEEQGLYSLKVLFLETMLAQDVILANLPKSSYPIIAKTIFEGIDIKNAHPEVYGDFSKLGPALVLVRMMKLDNDSNILDLINSNKDLAAFIERGQMLSPENVDIIFSTAFQKYLNH